MSYANFRSASALPKTRVDQLADYFVQTEQWRQLVRGQVDVVFGPKGAGKSAMYSTLLQLADAMYEDGIVLISAEKPRGTPAFRSLSEDAPASEIEFVSLWKMYILSLIGSMFDDMGIAGQGSDEVKSALVAEGLLPSSKASLGARLKMVLAGSVVASSPNPLREVSIWIRSLGCRPA